MLGRIKRYTGDALENLVTAGAVPPADILPVGLRLLSHGPAYRGSPASAVEQAVAAHRRAR